MKLFSRTVFAFLLLSSCAFAAPRGIDFNFNIQDDHFKLEIKQEFKKSLSEVRKKFTPEFLPQISNVVKSVQITPLKESISKVSVTGSKHGLSSTTVNICTEKTTSNEWVSVCSLDLDNEDTGDFFNSGTENIHCTTNPTGCSCSLIIEASVKPQRSLFLYRSAEVLALGGIVELIHDQAVLNRILNLNETPKIAKTKFEESNIGTCLGQIYSTYEGSAQKLAFTNKALEVQSSLWRCNP